jgi:hypothetical protein
VRIIAAATILCLSGCITPDLSTICPYGSKIITQGVFGQITDSTGANEEDVDVTISTTDGQGHPVMQFGDQKTGRAGFQLNASPSIYQVCAKSVCTIVTTTGLSELTATDGATLVWDAPVAVPPAETIGACTWGG